MYGLFRSASKKWIVRLISFKVSSLSRFPGNVNVQRTGSHCTWCTSDFRAIKAFKAGFQVGVCNFHSPRHCGGSTAFPRLPPHHSVSSFSLYLSHSFIPSSPLFLSVDLLSELHRFFRSCRLAVRNTTTESTGHGREGRLGTARPPQPTHSLASAETD